MSRFMQQFYGSLLENINKTFNNPRLFFLSFYTLAAMEQTRKVDLQRTLTMYRIVRREPVTDLERLITSVHKGRSEALHVQKDRLEKIYGLKGFASMVSAIPAKGYSRNKIQLLAAMLVWIPSAMFTAPGEEVKDSLVQTFIAFYLSPLGKKILGMIGEKYLNRLINSTFDTQYPVPDIRQFPLCVFAFYAFLWQKLDPKARIPLEDLESLLQCSKEPGNHPFFQELIRVTDGMECVSLVMDQNMFSLLLGAAAQKNSLPKREVDQLYAKATRSPSRKEDDDMSKWEREIFDIYWLLSRRKDNLPKIWSQSVKKPGIPIQDEGQWMYVSFMRMYFKKAFDKLEKESAGWYEKHTLSQIAAAAAIAFQEKEKNLRQAGYDRPNLPLRWIEYSFATAAALPLELLSARHPDYLSIICDTNPHADDGDLLDLIFQPMIVRLAMLLWKRPVLKACVERVPESSLFTPMSLSKSRAMLVNGDVSCAWLKDEMPFMDAVQCNQFSDRFENLLLDPHAGARLGRSLQDSFPACENLGLLYEHTLPDFMRQWHAFIYENSPAPNISDELLAGYVMGLILNPRLFPVMHPFTAWLTCACFPKWNPLMVPKKPA